MVITVAFLCTFYVLVVVSGVATTVGNYTVAFYVAPFRTQTAIFYIQSHPDTQINTTLVSLFHRNDPDVTNALAQRAAQKEDYIRTLFLFRRVMTLNPYNTEHRKAYLTFLIDHHLNSLFRDELMARGKFALDQTWVSRLYTAGLTFIQESSLGDALPFWKTAAAVSPSWSHVQIEYASLLRTLGRPDEARNVLLTCGKDKSAGVHCMTALYYFDTNRPTPLGYYQEQILSSK